MNINERRKELVDEILREKEIQSDVKSFLLLYAAMEEYRWRVEAIEREWILDKINEMSDRKAFKYAVNDLIG